MKNRIYSFLILIFTFWAMYGVYYYFFVLNKASITIQTNIDNYEVYLYNPQLKTALNSTCVNSKCELINLPPVEFEVTIKKSWYKDVKKSIILPKKSNVLLDFNLEKQVILTSKDFETTKRYQIDKIKNKNLLEISYKTFDLKDLWFFYFLNNSDSVSLNRIINWENQKLYDFNYAFKENINLYRVYWNSDYIFIDYDKAIYMYNITTWKVSLLKKYYDVKYVKYFNNRFYFILKDSIFSTDENFKDIQNFWLFKDFVQYDENHYLTYINSSDTELKQKYKLQDITWDLLLIYDTQTKKTTYKQNISVKISKLTFEEKYLYLYDENDNRYQIENIE